MRILLAVSGGIDSMYMANMASEIYPEATFAVAHCNFCLRGEESDEDERLVREWCSQHQMECFVKRFDTEGYSAAKGISIEMAARELRYAWFSELCTKHGFDAIAVAHNANDNAETLLLNLLRGTGSRGLRGMGAQSRRGGMTILRPLLGTSRAQISAYMKQNALPYREDSTNADTAFKRNNLRHNVLPVLEQINPSYLRTLASDMERFAQVDDIAEDYFQQAKAECVSEDGAIDLKKVCTYKHWEYLLFRFTEGHLNADGLLRLKKSVESGRPMGGKIFGPYTVKKGKLRII